MLCNRFETRSKNKNLRSQTDFIRSNASTSLYGSNSFVFLCFKVVADDSAGNQKFSFY